MKCIRLPILGAAIMACPSFGCDATEPPQGAAAGAVAGPTQRVLANKRFEDPAFKKMMTKTGGKATWSPEMAKKSPPGTPKR